MGVIESVEYFIPNHTRRRCTDIGYFPISVNAFSYTAWNVEIEQHRVNVASHVCVAVQPSEFPDERLFQCVVFHYSSMSFSILLTLLRHVTNITVDGIIGAAQMMNRIYASYLYE
ncbi:MAG: hypothetical protein RR382_00260 [Tannerellaceae bacterium]